MICWQCGQNIEKIGFRAFCARCGAYLHSCKGCKYFQEGLANDCRIPGTDRIADRSANNFCDEFSPLNEQRTSEKKDLGKSKTCFESLFKDS